MKTIDQKQITFAPENAAKASDWLANRGGIAVWQNKDLGSASIGSETYTPAITDGKETPAPHWRNGNSPVCIVTDPAAVFVESRKEVARVKIRRGPPYLGGVNRADRGKLDAALEAAGPGAGWTPDYSAMQYGSAWFVAVITIPDGRRPLNS